MKKVLIYLVITMLFITSTACSSTYGMEEETEGGEASPSVSLNIGDYVQLGRYYDVPILWRCVDIDENGMLMLSDKILCRKSFNAFNTQRRNSSKTGGWTVMYCSNDWKDSNIRTWLMSDAPVGHVEWLGGNTPHNPYGRVSGYYCDNGERFQKGFLAEGNFTQTERDVIKEVTQKSLLDPQDAEWAVGGSVDAWETSYSYFGSMPQIDRQEFVETQFDNICYEYTTDTVFLLDVKQYWNMVQNEDILGEGYRSTYPTQEAVENDEQEQRARRYHAEHYPGLKYDPYFSSEKICSYALRTPFGWGRMRPRDEPYPSGDRIFNSSSAIDANEGAGIRPAFYLNEATAKILLGSGTAEDPYVMNTQQGAGIGVYVNNLGLNFDVAPMVEDDRVLVPLRAVFEALGAQVEWYGEARTITAEREGTAVFMQIDDSYMSVNDEWVELDVPPRIVDGRTLIPLRAVAEAFGAQVEWNEGTQSVMVSL